MGICPVCGSFIDSGEPYCPDCGYIGSESAEEGFDFSIFDEDDLIEVLDEHGYDLDDLERGNIPDWELDEIYSELV